MVGNKAMDAGDRLNSVLTVAMGRSVESLETARQLRSAGFNTAAFVWAVRSVEIFVREFALLPYFLTSGLTFDRAWKRARGVLGGGNWVKAVATIEAAYGELDEMLTEDGENAWVVWSRHIPEMRGEFVHGSAARDASDDEVQNVIEWAGMLRQQLGLRLMTKRKHPAYAVIEEISKRSGWGAESTT